MSREVTALSKLCEHISGKSVSFEAVDQSNAKCYGWKNKLFYKIISFPNKIPPPNPRLVPKEYTLYTGLFSLFPNLCRLPGPQQFFARGKSAGSHAVRPGRLHSNPVLQPAHAVWQTSTQAPLPAANSSGGGRRAVLSLPWWNGEWRGKCFK